MSGGGGCCSAQIPSLPAVVLLSCIPHDQFLCLHAAFQVRQRKFQGSKGGSAGGLVADELIPGVVPAKMCLLHSLARMPHLQSLHILPRSARPRMARQIPTISLHDFEGRLHSDIAPQLTAAARDVGFFLIESECARGG